MKRRRFLTTAAVAAAAAGTAACSRGGPARGTATAQGPQQAEFRWKMVTTWPPNFPGLGTGANELARTLEACSNGRIRVKVYGAGELVPAFEVFDAVSRGTAELGHAGAYYWKGKAETASFFSSIPFGLNGAEMNAWLWHGGGMELWRETYAPFGVLPMPAGNSGVQMAGWFKKEIASVADLKGLKMRIPGLGGEVLARAGGTPVTLAAGDIFTALETGSIDAAEFVGPYNDLAFGLYKAAKFYYYPGWQEPGTVLECLINQRAFEALPPDLQQVVTTACRALNDSMLAEFNGRSFGALAQLVDVHKVQLKRLPGDVLRLLRRLSREVVAEKAGADPLFRRTLESYTAFEAGIANWTRIGEQAYLEARAL
jgi:TRAP-type mannitol/chloroaromatic compound transport system substrate-binding protein